MVEPSSDTPESWRGAPRALKSDQVNVWKHVLLPVVVAKGSVALAAFGNDLMVPLDQAESWTDDDGMVFWTGVFVISYAVFLHLSRCVTLGWHYMCEVLWGCNVSLLMAGYGMVSGKPLLVGSSACIVAVDQLAWYVDCMGYLLHGKFPIGVAKYLTSPSLSRVHFATSFHHLWFLPICLFCLANIGMPDHSVMFCIVIMSILAVAARFLAPYAVDEGSQIKVFNINMSHSFWDDIKLPMVHNYDHHPPYKYIPYLIVIGVILNTLPMLFLHALANYNCGKPIASWFNENENTNA